MQVMKTITNVDITVTAKKLKFAIFQLNRSNELGVASYQDKFSHRS